MDQDRAVSDGPESTDSAGAHYHGQEFSLRRRYRLFFFQAEDGIRDLIVTGVQTCALPISCIAGVLPALHNVWFERLACGFFQLVQIGRASCRERGVDLGGRRIIKKKKKKKKQKRKRRKIINKKKETQEKKKAK